jgi:hypothetical protein
VPPLDCRWRWGCRQSSGGLTSLSSNPLPLCVFLLIFLLLLLVCLFFSPWWDPRKKNLFLYSE